MQALNFNQYINFDEYLQATPEMWQKLHTDLCISMSKCSVRYGTSGYQHRSYPTRGLTGGTYLRNLVNELPEHLKATYEEMSIFDKTMFASYYWGYNSMPLIYVRATVEYQSKHTPEGSIANENTAHFDSLYKWIEEKNIFTQTGRITIFLSPQGYESRRHKDLPPDTPYKEVDEFIWLNPRGKKKFYLENDANKRAPITSQSAWFNSYQYHGAYPSQEQNYGVRIDGTFTDEARAYVESKR